MDANIISALIAATATLLVCMINNYHQQEAMRKQHDETIALISYKIEQLEKKQDIHNNAIERLYVVENKLGIDEEKIRSCKRRIDDLEHEKGRN